LRALEHLIPFPTRCFGVITAASITEQALTKRLSWRASARMDFQGRRCGQERDGYETLRSGTAYQQEQTLGNFPQARLIGTSPTLHI